MCLQLRCALCPMMQQQQTKPQPAARCFLSLCPRPAKQKGSPTNICCLLSSVLGATASGELSGGHLAATDLRTWIMPCRDLRLTRGVLVGRPCAQMPHKLVAINDCTSSWLCAALRQSPNITACLQALDAKMRITPGGGMLAAPVSESWWMYICIDSPDQVFNI